MNNSQSLKELKKCLYKAAGFMPIGIGLSLLFWLSESWIHTFRTGKNNLLHEILRPGFHEIWMRSLVCFIVIYFFVYAQTIIKKLCTTKARLQKLSEGLENHIRERTAELETAYKKLKGEMEERLAAEEALRKQRDKAQKYLDVAGVMLVHIDAEGKVTLINKKGCKILGYQEEEILGKNWFDNFLPATDREIVREIFFKLMAGEIEPVEYHENPVLTKDGETRIIAWHNIILREDGKIIGVLISGEDVTERKKAEEQLAIFKKFAESSTQGFGMADLEGYIIYCNDALCYNFLGEEEPEKALGKHISCYYDEKSAKILQQILPLVLEIGQWTGEIPLVSVSGKVTESIQSIFLIRNNKGEPAYFANVTTDITERKRAENKLRRHDEFLGSLLESLAHPFLVLNINDYKIEMANSAVRKGGLAKGMTCYEVSHGRDLPCDETESPCPLEQIKRTKQAVTMEHIHYDESGNARNVEVHCYPLFDDQGNVIKVIEYCLDITERKQLEEQAKRHQAELAHVSRLSAIGEMASGLAHELNQPLCAILSRSDLCLRALDIGSQNTDKIKENLKIIAGQAERAGNVIRRIKAFVKKREPNRSSVDISNVVRETLAFADSEIRNNNIKVSLDLREQIPMVLADRVQIEQVLLNLIRNAIEAMAETEQDKRYLIIQVSQDSDDRIKVAVRDSGEGLTPEVEEHLFDAFFSTKPNDLGIGLSISRSIINVHQGDLWGQRNPDGNGSTFTFTLPISESMVYT